MVLASSVTAVTITLFSYHLDQGFRHREGFNEFNPGVVLELDRRWLVGAYRNSFDRNTVFVGHRFAIDSAYGVRFSLDVALDLNRSYRSPLIGAPCATYSQVTLCVVPPGAENSGITLALGLTKRF